MCIHLYLSPAIGGKTAYAVARAREVSKEMGGAVVACVANQLQRRAWKERLAEMGGALGVQVWTFGELSRALLGASGDASTLLDDAMQHSLLRHNLDGIPLDHYSSLRAKPGFVVLLHKLIAELKAARIDAQRFADAMAALGNEKRLVELAWIYSAYQGSLGMNGWADEEELGWLVLRALQDRPTLAADWSLLVVDGFDNLTTLQLDLLRIITGRVRETLITLSGAPDGLERGLVHRRFMATRQTLEQALGVQAEPLPATAAKGSIAPHRAAGAVAHLERSLFVSQARPYVPVDSAEASHPPALIAAADRAGEVRAALRWVKARLVRDGFRPMEVALLARRMAPYRSFIQEIAREFGLPIRLLEGLPLASNPAVAALSDALRLSLPLSSHDAQPSFPRRLVVEAWRSPYLDWGAVNASRGDEQLELGTYPALAGSLDGLARWGRVVAGVAQWREAFARRLGCETQVLGADEEEGPGGLPSVNRVRELLEPFERLVERLAPPVADTAADYVAWLEALIGPDRAEKPEDDGSLGLVWRARQGEGLSAERDVAALRALKDVLRGLVWVERSLEAPAPTNYAAFYAQLQAAIGASVYYPPDGRDADAICVADVVQARGVPFRAVAVLGLAEGEFPLALQEDPLLRDSDRRRLSALGLGLPPSTESAEAEYFYETVTRARDRLLLTRPRLAENGAVWEASPYWEEICRLVDIKPEVLSSESRIRPDEAASWPELLDALAAYPAGSPWHTWAHDANAARYRAWQDAGQVFEERYARHPSGPHNGDLSAQAIELGRRYGPQHIWSASRLESYRTCPQGFFVGAALGLEPRSEPVEGLDARQLGNIYHRLFQEVYKACPEESRNDIAQLRGALERIGPEILGQAPQREGFRETAWWPQTQDEILNVVRHSLEELASRAEEYTATDFELLFDAVPIWQSPDGQDRLQLRGVIDRVDRCAGGGCRIIDYKTAGPAHFKPRALEQGRKLQLPLYALAMAKLSAGEVRDGFYWHVRQAQSSTLTLQAYGVSESMEDALRFAQEAVQGIRRGAFGPHPPPEGCPGYCPAAAFCWSFRPSYGG